MNPLRRLWRPRALPGAFPYRLRRIPCGATAEPGNSGGVEPATSAFTGPRANRCTTNCITPDSDPGWTRTTALLRVREAPSPLGYRIRSSAPARSRTRTATFEAWNDVRFTTRAAATVSTPARSRTWIPTFGGWCRRPLDHQGRSAEGEGVEPSYPRGRRLSKPVRYQFRTPFRFRQWTRRESNPDCRHAIPASSR